MSAWYCLLLDVVPECLSDSEGCVFHADADLALFVCGVVNVSAFLGFCFMLAVERK